MKAAKGTSFSTHNVTVKDRDATVILSSVILAIVLLIGIYMASMSSGTAPGEFASMTVFP